ncbi:Pxr1, partial [Ophiophagus hannah]
MKAIWRTSGQSPEDSETERKRKEEKGRKEKERVKEKEDEGRKEGRKVKERERKKGKGKKEGKKEGKKKETERQRERERRKKKRTAAGIEEARAKYINLFANSESDETPPQPLAPFTPRCLFISITKLKSQHCPKTSLWSCGRHD